MIKKAALIVLFSFSASLAGSAWVSETVAEQGDVGAGCSLAVDRWGRPHISYVDKTQESVMYALYVGSEWQIETVASGVEPYGSTSLALDAFANPHLAFQDLKTNELTYAYKSGGSWTTEKIDDGEGIGAYVCMGSWPTGPRVSYSIPAGMNTGLKYAYRDTGGWHPETVLSSGGGEFNSIFKDNQGDVHIIFWSGDQSGARSAKLSAGEWSFSDITGGTDPSAVLGPNNKFHASMATMSNDGLIYAVSTDGETWTTEPIDTAVGSPAFTDICVNGSGNIFITYFNFDNWDLHVVTKEATTWTHELVATGSYLGLPNSIAVGSGYPLIAYYEGDNADLKLARYDTLSDIELKSFTAEREAGGVDLRWTVDGTRNVSGFNLYRAAENAAREKVNNLRIQGSSPYLYHDGDAAGNVAYYYWLEAVATTGTKRTFGPAKVPPALTPKTYVLHQNLPNPAVETTTFSFVLPEGNQIELAIYDVAGRKVTTVAEGYHSAGRHDISYKIDLSPGVYLYRLVSGSNVLTHKMVVAR